MNTETLRTTLRLIKALADGQRLRILMMLRSGELCVCQIIAVLGLAPSTVSKHLSILTQAGLLDFRKDGRWAYYRLANGAETQSPLDWLATSLADDGQIRVDQEKLATINACDPQSIARRQRMSGGASGLPCEAKVSCFAFQATQDKSQDKPSPPRDGGDTENALQKKSKKR